MHGTASFFPLPPAQCPLVQCVSLTVTSANVVAHLPCGAGLSTCRPAQLEGLQGLGHRLQLRAKQAFIGWNMGKVRRQFASVSSPGPSNISLGRHSISALV